MYELFCSCVRRTSVTTLDESTNCIFNFHPKTQRMMNFITYVIKGLISLSTKFQWIFCTLSLSANIISTLLRCFENFVNFFWTNWRFLCCLERAGKREHNSSSNALKPRNHFGVSSEKESEWVPWAHVGLWLRLKWLSWQWLYPRYLHVQKTDCQKTIWLSKLNLKTSHRCASLEKWSSSFSDQNSCK